MEHKIQLKFLRKPEARERYGLSNTAFYLRVKEGLLPPPCSLGERAVGFPEHEVTTVIAAMMAGKDKEQLKNLVATLVAQRENIMEVSQ